MLCKKYSSMYKSICLLTFVLYLLKNYVTVFLAFDFSSVLRYLRSYAEIDRE